MAPPPRSYFLNILFLPTGTTSSNFSLYLRMASVVWSLETKLRSAALVDRLSISFYRRLIHEVFKLFLSFIPFETTLSNLGMFYWEGVLISVWCREKSGNIAWFYSSASIILWSVFPWPFFDWLKLLRLASMDCVVLLFFMKLLTEWFEFCYCLLASSRWPVVKRTELPLALLFLESFILLEEE